MQTRKKSTFTQIITDFSKSKNLALNSHQKPELKQRKRSNHEHSKHIQIVKVVNIPKIQEKRKETRIPE